MPATETTPPTHTPWGDIQHQCKIADGIYVVSTAGHEGVWLSPARNKKIPESCRNRGGWYEGDSEWSIPVLVFMAEFKQGKDNPDQLEIDAVNTCKDWYPCAYRAITGKKVTPRESYLLRKKRFHEEHKNDLQVVTAWGSYRDNVPEGMVGVLAVRGGRTPDGLYASDEQRYFLIPQEEYAEQRERNHEQAFIIDPERHEEIDAI